MMLPKTAEYALRAAVWLGRDPTRSEKADNLARETKVPRRYLHKVLQDLVSAGLVRSQPGPGGGYSLARSADETTMLDVVEAVAPPARSLRWPVGLTAHAVHGRAPEELDGVY